MSTTVTGLPSQLQRSPSPFTTDAPRLKAKPYQPTHTASSNSNLDAERSIAIAMSVSPEEKPTDIDNCLSFLRTCLYGLFSSLSQIVIYTLKTQTKKQTTSKLPSDMFELLLSSFSLSPPSSLDDPTGLSFTGSRLTSSKPITFGALERRGGYIMAMPGYMWQETRPPITTLAP